MHRHINGLKTQKNEIVGRSICNKRFLSYNPWPKQTLIDVK